MTDKKEIIKIMEWIKEKEKIYKEKRNKEMKDNGKTSSSDYYWGIVSGLSMVRSELSLLALRHIDINIKKEK